VATAFLGAGAATVVAGVTRVADAGAPEVMAAFHQGIAAGRGPAEALAGAATGTGFVCFGAG
jgi:CHAT domain-containing protein